MRAEQVTDPVTHHGEGPVWSPRWPGGGGLRFVDMLAGDVLTLREQDRVDRRHVGTVAAVVRPRRAGGAVIGVERGFVLEEPDGTLSPLPDLWHDDSQRMNEGGCDPDGRFYCGSMAYDQATGAATLYRLDADHDVRPVLHGSPSPTAWSGRRTGRRPTTTTRPPPGSASSTTTASRASPPVVRSSRWCTTASPGSPTDSPSTPTAACGRRCPTVAPSTVTAPTAY